MQSFWKIYSGTQCGGFQFLLILDLYGIIFHDVIVFGLGKNVLFKSVLGHCEPLVIGTSKILTNECRT